MVGHPNGLSRRHLTMWEWTTAEMQGFRCKSRHTCVEIIIETMEARNLQDKGTVTGDRQMIKDEPWGRTARGLEENRSWQRIKNINTHKGAKLLTKK